MTDKPDKPEVDEHDDDIVAEVHRIRDELAAEDNYDLDAMYQRFHDEERKGTHRILQWTPDGYEDVTEKIKNGEI